MPSHVQKSDGTDGGNISGLAEFNHFAAQGFEFFKIKFLLAKITAVAFGVVAGLQAIRADNLP